jgi:hypothetical protein
VDDLAWYEGQYESGGAQGAGAAAEEQEESLWSRPGSRRRKAAAARAGEEEGEDWARAGSGRPSPRLRRRLQAGPADSLDASSVQGGSRAEGE